MRRLFDSSSRGPFARVLEPFGFYSPKQDTAFASMLEKICELAAKRGLRVLLIGGHAVIAHGHPRNTFDIDCIIEVKDQGAWRGLLEGLGYSLHAETRTFFQMQPSDEQTLPVDVMMVNEPTFAKMLALAQECSALPPNARVVSLGPGLIHHSLLLHRLAASASGMPA